MSRPIWLVVFFYRDLQSLRAYLPASLASGPRVLKANRGAQGAAVWLLTETETGEVLMEHAKNNSSATLSMDAVCKKLAEVISAPLENMDTGWGAKEAQGYVVDQMYFPEVKTMGELRVTMVGSEPREIQRRVPAKGSFSATFKAGAAFSRVEESDPVWKGVRETLAKSLPGLAEAAGCPAGTPLPLLWAVELLPLAGAWVAGELDVGCIGISASLHLCAPLAAEAMRRLKKS